MGKGFDWIAIVLWRQGGAVDLCITTFCTCLNKSVVHFSFNYVLWQICSFCPSIYVSGRAVLLLNNKLLVMILLQHRSVQQFTCRRSIEVYL